MSTTQVNEPAASSQALDARGAATKKSWRDTIKIHPAANLFPMMSDEEIDALAADIKKNGLTSPIVYWRDPKKLDELLLLDGRNRLEAAQRAGYKIRIEDIADYTPIDPYAYVISANIHRRHLTAEQKDDLIVKVLAANPAKSDREVAKTVKVDHKKVGRVRKRAEATGAVAPVEKRTGADGKTRKQPARRPAPRADRLKQLKAKREQKKQAAKEERIRQHEERSSRAQGRRRRLRGGDQRADRHRELHLAGSRVDG
jgi:ParB-like chromosome segregation protein Spo0J